MPEVSKHSCKRSCKRSRKKLTIFGETFSRSKTGEKELRRHINNVRNKQIEYLRNEVLRLQKLNKEAERKHKS